MASRTSTDPIEILLEMGVDLDNLSEEEDYLSALKEAIATIQFQTKGAGDERSTILQQEVVKVRKQRKAADPKFKARKTKISADVFKKGSATGVNIAPKALPTSALVPYQAPETEEEGEEKKKRKPKEKNLLAEIAKSVTNIADILKDQYKLKKKEGEFDRKKAQNDKRKLQEAGLEKRFKTLFKTAQKIIAPVRSLFDKILGFLFNVLLAKFLTKVVNWFADPKNQKKIQSIIRFFGDHWKKLLSLYLVFGTGLGKFVLGLSKLLITGAVKLGIAVAKLAAAKGVGGARKLARMLGGKKAKFLIGAGATALTVGGTMMGVNALTGGDGQQTQGFSGGGLAKTPKVEPLPKNVERKQGMSGAQKGMAFGSLFGPIGMLAGAGIGSLFDKFGKKDNTVTLSKPASVELEVPSGTEGEVDGPGGTDKVPAMLTAGEFVMSRGAVQKYGVKTLEGMNSAGGGTNQPKVIKDRVYAKEGGYIGDREKAPDRNLTPVDPVEGKPYASGSLVSDPLGALDRILGQSSGGKFRLPGSGSKSTTPPPKSDPQPQPNRPPKSKPDSTPKQPLVPPKTSKQETSADQTAMSIPEKMLKSPTFRDSGVLYLRSMLGGFGGKITEQDLSKASKDELNKAIARAKKRTAGELRTAEQDLVKAKAGNYSNIAEIQSRYDRLKRGEVRVLYQDYYEGGKITPAAEDAKSILGKFWAATTENGGYKVVNEKYDFVDMKDPLAVLMGDSSGVSEKAKPGQPITLRQRLQAMHQLNPFARDMSVDMVLGQKETAERKMNNFMSKVGGVADFFTGNAFDFDRQGGSTLMNPSGQKLPTAAKPKGKPQPEPSKPKITAQQIKNNQAYAASKGKYYSSTTGKTYANYAEALKDPEVAAGAKKMEQKKQSTMNMILGGKDAYYSSTTGMYYKNYAEALKDPKVKAAAEIEKTKKRLSFAPQNPNVLTPQQPSANNIQVINVGGNQQQQDKSNSNRSGSNTPPVNAGNGDKGKWKIFGIPMPF